MLRVYKENTQQEKLYYNMYKNQIYNYGSFIADNTYPNKE